MTSRPLRSRQAAAPAADTAALKLQFPGREAGIDLLADQLRLPGSATGTDSDDAGHKKVLSMHCLLYGPPATGKTTVVRGLLTALRLRHAYINCHEAGRLRPLLCSVLHQLKGGKRQRDEGYEAGTKCDSLADFRLQLQGVVGRCGDPCWLVLDNAQRLGASELLAALLRMREDTGVQLAVLLVSSGSGWASGRYMRDTVAAPQPAEVCFQAYTPLELQRIVEHCWHRQQCKVTGGGGEAAALTQFLTAFVPTFCRASNNLLDLRAAVAHLFPLYMQPLRGPQPAKLPWQQLYSRIKGQVQQCVRGMHLQHQRAPGDSGGHAPSTTVPPLAHSSVPAATTWDQVRAVVRRASHCGLSFELPYVSKFLLLAAYVASRNRPTSDRSVFDPSHKQRGRRDAQAHDRQVEAAVEAKLRGPHSFPLERLLHVFYALFGQHDAEDEQEGGSQSQRQGRGDGGGGRGAAELEQRDMQQADVLQQVTSLVALRLLEQCGGDVLDGQLYRCNLGEAAAEALGHNLSSSAVNNDHGYMQAMAPDFVPFLVTAHRGDLLQVLKAPDADKHYGVRLTLAELSTHCGPQAAESVLRAPRQMLSLLDEALVLAQEQARREADPSGMAGLVPKLAVHARLAGLTLHQDGKAREVSPGAGSVGSPHIDRLLTICGTVTKAGPVKVLEARRLYLCTRCKHSFWVPVNVELMGLVQAPQACPSQRDKPCTATSFKHCEEAAVYTNWQQVRVQEQASSSYGCGGSGGGGSGTPRALSVLLLDELADSCQVGEEVEVTGVVIRQFGAVAPGRRCQVTLALQATSLTVGSERRAEEEVPPEAAAAFVQFWQAHAACPLLGRNKIVASVCPELHGLFTVKLATLLMLVGGVARWEPGCARSRGEAHMLLVGDPGTAGLTAAAVHDAGGWSLEAGALVLADGGVCLIDEFDGIAEGDRAAVHEAMEQQTTSVAKAGMIVSLHTRAAVFATCNPGRNQRYNPRLPLASQLNMGGPLLSRFDIVILLMDHMDPAWDNVVATHILHTHKCRGGDASSQAATNDGWGQQQQQQQSGTAAVAEGWSLASLRQYIQWAKAVSRPTISRNAERLLSAYFQLRRQHEGRQASRTTVRLLESLVRVAQAHARLMARHEVTMQDAAVAVWLQECSCVDEASSPLGHVLMASGAPATSGSQSFPKDPDADHATMEEALAAAVLGSSSMGQS
ncbi:putative DNA helicase MCM9 [Chlorella vulgaris]